MTEASLPSSLALARLCARALEGKLATEVRILDVSAISSITNAIVIGTATSQTHLRALRIELEKVLDESKNRIVGIETAEESGWTIVDAFDVMVHVFTEERRRLYGLEKLWKDAPEVPLKEVAPQAPVSQSDPVARPPRKTKAPARAKPAAAVKSAPKTKPVQKAKAAKTKPSGGVAPAASKKSGPPVHKRVTRSKAGKKDKKS